jgi:hypothetical protein
MLSTQDMMRELVAYAHEEMRNRGLEEAARLIEARAGSCGGQTRWAGEQDAIAIRALKRDASKQLSDWWAGSKPALERTTVEMMADQSDGLFLKGAITDAYEAGYHIDPETGKIITKAG